MKATRLKTMKVAHLTPTIEAMDSSRTEGSILTPLPSTSTTIEAGWRTPAPLTLDRRLERLVGSRAVTVEWSTNLVSGECVQEGKDYLQRQLQKLTNENQLLMEDNRKLQVDIKSWVVERDVMDKLIQRVSSRQLEATEETGREYVDKQLRQVGQRLTAMEEKVGVYVTPRSITTPGVVDMGEAVPTLPPYSSEESEDDHRYSRRTSRELGSPPVIRSLSPREGSAETEIDIGNTSSIW